VGATAEIIVPLSGEELREGGKGEAAFSSPYLAKTFCSQKTPVRPGAFARHQKSEAVHNCSLPMEHFVA